MDSLWSHEKMSGFPNMTFCNECFSNYIHVWSSRRDTYNKQLWKYLVEVDEDDEEHEEDLEKETKTTLKAFQLIVH